MSVGLLVLSFKHDEEAWSCRILYKLGKPDDQLQVGLSTEERRDIDGAPLESLLAKAAFSSGSSAYRGVRVHKPNGKWQAQISIKGKTQQLGYYKSETEAARAYDQAAIEFHGR